MKLNSPVLMSLRFRGTQLYTVCVPALPTISMSQDLTTLLVNLQGAVSAEGLAGGSAITG